MEPLFKTTLKYTLKEYEKFNNAVIKPKLIKVIIYLSLLVVCAGLLYILNPNSYLPLFLLIFIIIYPAMLYFSIKSKAKKTYESNILIKDLTESIEFYEEYFIVKTENSEAKVEYNKLYKILETDENFYLMIADNQGYLVLKENCEDELIRFVIKTKNKLSERRK